MFGHYFYELFATHYLTISKLSLLFWLRNEEGTKDRFYCLKEISAYTCQDYTMGSANPNHAINSFTNGLKLLIFKHRFAVFGQGSNLKSVVIQVDNAIFRFFINLKNGLGTHVLCTHFAF